MQPMTEYPNQVQVQQPITDVQPVPPANNDFRTLYKKASTCLGATQVTIGILAIIFQIVTMKAPVPSYEGFVGTGFWTGTFFIISGSIGIAKSKNQSKGWAIALLVLNSVSISMAVGLVTAGSTSLMFDVYQDDCYHYRYEHDKNDPRMYNICMKKVHVTLAADGILIILGFVEFIIAIIASGFECGTLCCFSTTSNQVIYQGQNGAVFVQGGPAEGYQLQQNVQGQGYPLQPPPYQMHEGQGQPTLQQNQPTPQVQSPLTHATPSATPGHTNQSEDHVYQGLEKDMTTQLL